MKKIRNLLAMLSCSALVILGIQLRAAAQQSPKRPEQTAESPRDLGRNAGTGDPVLRTGTWELDGIKTTAFNPVTGPRETKDLPVNTRSRSGIAFSEHKHLIKAAVVFMDLKETVTGTNASGANPSLTVLVKTEVMTVKDLRGKNDYLPMRCNIDFTLASGDKGQGTWRDFKIYPAHYPDYKKDEFTCGGDLRPPYIGGKDFTLNLELRFYTNEPIDVTYHFYYRFRGWKVANPTSGPTSPPGDARVAPTDRDGQYRWAQKQDAATLASTLSSAASRLFNSPSVSAEKLSSAFADVSVIIADRAGSANFPAGDKDAASNNWTTHKNWAARQGPKTSLENLQQKLSAAFSYLSRSQKDLFFADASVAMAKAEVGGSGNEAAAASQSQDRPLVKPTKSVFGVNEDITIDYYNPKGSGWDWVVIVDPNRTAEAKGSFNAIDERYDERFDPNDNSLKVRDGTFTFRGLPEGEYEVRYVAWYLDGRAGANQILGPVRFRVGNQVSASPPPGPAPGTNVPTAVNPAKDLTGLWRNPGANAFYRVRQIGPKLVWGIDAVAMGSWANVFQGQIAGNTIDGVWEDLPGSPTIGGGRMLLRIESECRFVRLSSVNPYGADVWVKKDSTCDVTGQAQRSNPSGAQPANRATKPAATNKQNPPVVAINDRDRVFEKPDPTNKPNKPAPVVEEIPEDNSPNVAANTPARKPGNKPPVVEEIPEDTPTTIASNKPSSRSGGSPPVVEEIPETPPVNNPGSNRSSGNSSPSNKSEKEKLPPGVKRDKNGKLQPKDGWEWVNPNDPNDTRVQKKPKDPNKPDFWTQLGGALREAITQPPQPGTTAGPQQQDGTCRGGSYWLGTPTPDSWRLGTPGAGVRVPWSTPIGVRKASLRIFRGGQDVTGPMALPENSNDCGLSWSLYMNAAGYYDVYLYDPNGTAVAGPVRFTVYQ